MIPSPSRRRGCSSIHDMLEHRNAIPAKPTRVVIIGAGGFVGGAIGRQLAVGYLLDSYGITVAENFSGTGDRCPADIQEFGGCLN